MKNSHEHGIIGQASSLIEAGEPAVLVEVVGAKGSTPREQGAAMLVTDNGMHGTIGGGQLEWIALDEARRLLAENGSHSHKEIPLGPAIGQCCGGHVSLDFTRMTAAEIDNAAKRLAEPARPQVRIFGAGHTGTALAKALSLLPFSVSMIDPREDALSGLEDICETVLTPLPEGEVRASEPGAAFVVLTHEHSLDFLITAEALKRDDAAYVGMIGSATKRAVFKSWLKDNAYDPAMAENLTCPIGGSAVRDKRPEVIAALVAAELIGVFAGR